MRLMNLFRIRVQAPSGCRELRADPLTIEEQSWKLLCLVGLGDVGCQPNADSFCDDTAAGKRTPLSASGIQ